jgi:hypothetical protein
MIAWVSMGRQGLHFPKSTQHMGFYKAREPTKAVERQGSR